MPRNQTSTGPTLTSPIWTNDILGPEHLIQGGKANAADAGFVADANGKKPVASGTIVGRTLAERDASTGYGPAGDTDDEVYIVAFDVDDLNTINDIELVRPNTVLKENFLPGFAAASAAVKAKVRAAYRCMRGAE